MKIAFSTIYGDLYKEDRQFDNSSCVIGENLLMPNIKLKEALENKGHIVHTIDMYARRNYDFVFFQEIPSYSFLTIEKPTDYLKYFLKAKWRHDYLWQAVKRLPKERIVLQIIEPPVIAPQSYNKKYHKYFGKILTWDDTLVDGKKYIKRCFPQYWTGDICHVEHGRKKEYVIIAGNKKSSYKNELYSERRAVIDFFEKWSGSGIFDLYGVGWQAENLKNYRGAVEKKIKTLSQYKFCFCFENMKNIKGYITEKIFDCFFAGCIPIYLGADNVEEYIPEGAFIDMRKFKDVQDVVAYTADMSVQEFETYISKAEEFLKSKKFSDFFSVEKYISAFLGVLA